MAGDRGSQHLDEEELGRATQLAYEAFSVLEGMGASLSPYVPTQEEVMEPILALVQASANRRGSQCPPVYYEPGCGAGRVASRAAESGLYVLCLELDEELAAKAADKARRSPLMDTVVGDLTVFRPRRVDAAYLYLLPVAVARVLEVLRGLHAPVYSLDYPALGDHGALRAARLIIGGRSLYVYES